MSCKKGPLCESVTVYLSKQCGVDWEAESEGTRYPVQTLPDVLKRAKNRIEIYQYHFYDSPRSCPCCGYHYLEINAAKDELIHI